MPPIQEKIRVNTRKERNYKGLQKARVAYPNWPAHQARRFPYEMSVRKLIVAR